MNYLVKWFDADGRSFSGPQCVRYQEAIGAAAAPPLPATWARVYSGNDTLLSLSLEEMRGEAERLRSAVGPVERVTTAGVLSWGNACHEPGFFIGSEGDNGEHLRSDIGWPYSIYRRTKEIGGCDMVLCGGIQSRDDAITLVELLNTRKG